jgi:CDP-diacylglycerol--serine O-phosphatidyltransferase
MRRHIPNFITSLNLLAGCFAVVFALTMDLRWSSWMIGIAAIFDFADGFVARFLKVQSKFGMVLDSLADVVSFGLAPGLIMYSMIKMNIIPANTFPGSAIAYSALLIPVFSALRLAKFSIDDRQSEQFLGLPTPANAILIASFPLILAYHGNPGFVTSIFHNNYLLICITVILSILLVSNIPMMALKFKSFRVEKNVPKYALIILAIILLIIFDYLAIPMIFLSYILLSVILLRKN